MSSLQLKKDTIETLKKFLSDPLNPLPENEMGKIRPLVEEPIKNPFTSPGGLKRGIAEALKTRGIDLTLESKSHKENTRTKITAPLAVAELFTKSKKEQLSPQENEHLLKGIGILRPDGTQDSIPTVKKRGRMMTNEFKKIMSELYGSLKRHGGPKTALDIISGAAALQKLAEKEEATLRQDVPAMG